MFRTFQVVVSSLVFAILVCSLQVSIGYANQDVDKLPVPPINLQVKYRDEIRGSAEFKVDESTVEAAQQSAEKLVKAGRSEDEIAAKKYAFYREGLRVALSNCDPTTAMFAIDQLDTDFQIDFWEFVVSSTDALRKSAKTEPQRQSVRQTIDKFINQAVTNEEFEVAKNLVGKSIVLSGALDDDSGKSKRQEYKKEISSLSSFAAGGKKAEETLAESPDDPKACLAMGHYLVFVKSDFENGLKNWGKSESSKFKKLAMVELDVDTSKPYDLFRLAGQWIEASEKMSGVRERRFKERARHWYKLSVGGLEGDAMNTATAKISSLNRILDPERLNHSSPAGLEKPTKLSPEVQAAVDKALQWIVAHQLPDGSWSYKHSFGPGDFRKTPGDSEAVENAPLAATAMALLVFSKTGQTNKKGAYQTNIQKGLSFLVAGGRKAGRGISYQHEAGGTMYSHGLAARALVRQYQLSNDRNLRKQAQGTVWFIEDAQDLVGGGWRYRPREPGDTSVLGWQITALEAALEAGLDTSKETSDRAKRFLDTVASPDGIAFGYASPPRSSSMGVDARSVIGILCREKLGMDKSDPRFQKVVKKVLDKGVSSKFANPYYHYYATLLMKTQGGADWETWKADLHKVLLNLQSIKPNEAGSWWVEEKTHATAKSGRMGATLFALLCLLE